MTDDLWDLADAWFCVAIASDQVLSHVPGYETLKSIGLDMVFGPAEALELVCTRPGAPD